MTYHKCLRHGPCITNIWLNNKTCIEIINNNITICACALYLNSESWQCLSRLSISLPCLWNRGGKTLTLRTESRPRENNLHTTKVFYFFKDSRDSHTRMSTHLSVGYTREYLLSAKTATYSLFHTIFPPLNATASPSLTWPAACGFHRLSS